MNCNKCFAVAVTQKPPYCDKHFISYFEAKVKRTISKFKLINKKDKIVVAASGGKDSITTLYLMNKFYKKRVSAIAIDEGISGYRDATLKDLKSFCGNHRIPLKIHSYMVEFGLSIDKIAPLASNRLCGVCGALRRYLLNTKSKGATKLATGHNLDDEAQSILMNFLRNDMQSNAKLGPITGVGHGPFTQRIKPLYLCAEKEVRTYAFLKGFDIQFIECAYASNSYRAFVRDRLNDYEQKNPGAKERLVHNFLEILPKLKRLYGSFEKQKYCKVCKEPCSGEVCHVCLVKKRYGAKAINLI